MKSLFYFLAVVAIGAAGFFGWKTRDAATAQIKERIALQERSNNLETTIKKREEDRGNEEAALKVARDERAVAQAGLEAAKSNAGDYERTLEDLDGKLEEQQARQKQIDEVLISIKKLFPGVDDLSEVPAIVAGLKDKKKKLDQRLDAGNTVKERLSEDVAKNKAAIARVEEKIRESKKRVARNTFQATVTAVDNDWDFAIIGAGENSGLAGDSRLLVLRGGRLLGKLTIAKLEANRAIADIVPDSLPAGVVLQRGDQVILEKVRSN